nr:uncharacterized protein LOC124818793 [Hydra vulgaris]
MYAILEYIETKEIDFLPIKWMVERLNWDVKNLIKNKTLLSFYYPPVKAANKVLNAKKICSNPEEHWHLYKTLLKAQKKKQSRLKIHQMLIMIRMILVTVEIWKHEKLEKENILLSMKVKLLMMKLKTIFKKAKQEIQTSVVLLNKHHLIT